jgi:hypothetical protein
MAYDAVGFIATVNGPLLGVVSFFARCKGAGGHGANGACFEACMKAVPASMKSPSAKAHPEAPSTSKTSADDRFVRNP